MAEPDPKPLESILRLCAGADPAPWYPSEHAKAAGIDRDSLDAPLEKLRLGGLIQLTDWVQGKGQGYQLTAEGTALLQDGRALERLQTGQLPPRPPPAPGDEPERAEHATVFERGEAIRDSFLNPSIPFITRFLIAVNVLAFVVEQSVDQQQGAVRQLVDQVMAVNRRTIALGQWWRLLTYAFFHGGLMHLAMNMYVLYTLGGNAERLWGHGRFAVLYLLSALGGGCAVVLTTDVGAVGASGAICGLFAAEGIWLVLNRAFLPPPMVASWMRSLTMNAILITVISFLPGISAAGHFGGALAGAAVSLLLHSQRFGAPLQRLTALLGLTLFPVACVGLIVWQMQTSAAWRPVRGILKDGDQATGLLERAEQMTRSVLRMVQEQVLPTAKLPPLGRNPAAVKDMLSGLAQLRAESEKRLVETVATGRFPDEGSEAKRQRAKNLLGESVTLCQLAQAALQAAGDWQARSEALEKAADQLARLRLE